MYRIVEKSRFSEKVVRLVVDLRGLPVMTTIFLLINILSLLKFSAVLTLVPAHIIILA